MPDVEVLLEPAEIPTLVRPALTPFDTVVELVPEFLLVPVVLVVVVVVVVDCGYILPFCPSGVLQGAPAPCNPFTILFASGLWEKPINGMVRARSAVTNSFFIQIRYVAVFNP